MTICQRCHRPLSKPTESGMGRVCEKLALPAPEVERDLFGYDVAAAALVAQAKQALWLDARVFQAQRELDAEFKAAWTRWEARA